MVIPLKPIDQPLFPLRIIHLDDGLMVELNNLKEVGSYLEFHDSDDPEDSKEVLVLDGARRRVRILVYAFEVKRCELYDTTPLSEEEITCLLKVARQAQIEAREQNVLRRLWKWFKGSG